MSRQIKIAIIGGTGLDNPDLLDNRQEKFVTTPFGKPSDALILGRIKGVDCVILARHGRKHDIMPSNINFRANIWALKQEGCTHVLATTACGSLQELMAPGDIVFLDQFIDRTYRRIQTFYDGAETSPKGICHLPMAHPFCEHTRQVLIEAATDLEMKFHPRGTNITVEGPRFSSKAESNVWRMMGGSIINMTSVPEVVLARESALCYASMALVTDYDCWKDDVEHVSLEQVMSTMKTNSKKATELILEAIPRIAKKDWSAILEEYENQVKNSIML